MSIPHRTRARLYGDDGGASLPEQDVIPADITSLIDEIQNVAYEIRVLAERFRDSNLE
jgi:hypothetical protein